MTSRGFPLPLDSRSFPSTRSTSALGMIAMLKTRSQRGNGMRIPICDCDCEGCPPDDREHVVPAQPITWMQRRGDRRFKYTYYLCGLEAPMQK